LLQLLADKDHLPRRPSSVVSYPENNQSLLQPKAVLYLPWTHHLVNRYRFIVAVCAGFQNTRAIRRFPPTKVDAIVTAHVVVVNYAHIAQQLRDLPRVAERVG
jgi:hypothetical protein